MSFFINEMPLPKATFMEKPTMVVRDKADDEADTERIGEESNAVSGRHGAVFCEVTYGTAH